MEFGELLGWRRQPYDDRMATLNSLGTEAPMLTILPNLAMFASLNDCSFVSFLISPIINGNGK